MFNFNPNGSSDACIIPDIPDNGSNTAYERALRATPEMSKLS